MAVSWKVATYTACMLNVINLTKHRKNSYLKNHNILYVKLQTYSVYIRGQLQNGGKNVRVNARELAGFGLLMFAFYCCMPLIMKVSSATVVNNSVLTADLFAVFAGTSCLSKITPLVLGCLGDHCCCVVGLQHEQLRVTIKNKEKNHTLKRQKLVFQAFEYVK